MVDHQEYEYSCKCYCFTLIFVEMKTLGFTLLGIVAAIYIVAMIIGMIAAFPFGIIGLIAIAGVGSLFIHVLAERLNNKEDDYYDKNVKQ